MIFPNEIPSITFFSPRNNQYYELSISYARTNFSIVDFYTRESISGVKDYKPKGIDFSCDLSFDLSVDHEVMRLLINEMMLSPNMDLYLSPRDDIGSSSDSLQVISTSIAANLLYRSQRGLHGYSMSFYGNITQESIGVFFVIDNSGIFILTNDGSKILTNVSVF